MTQPRRKQARVLAVAARKPVEVAPSEEAALAAYQVAWDVAKTEARMFTQRNVWLIVINLAVLAYLVVSMATVPPGYVHVLKLVGIAGMLTSVGWFLSNQRSRLHLAYSYQQLRALEEQIGMPKVFTGGYELFAKGKRSGEGAEAVQLDAFTRTPIGTALSAVAVVFGVVWLGLGVAVGRWGFVGWTIVVVLLCWLFLYLAGQGKEAIALFWAPEEPREG